MNISVHYIFIYLSNYYINSEEICLNLHTTSFVAEPTLKSHFSKMKVFSMLQLVREL